MSLQKNVKSHVFWILKKNVFSNYASSSSCNNMQLKETCFFDVCTEKWLRKYLVSIYNLFTNLCQF